MSGSTALGLGVTLCAIAVTLLVIVAWTAWDARRSRRGLLERVGAAQPDAEPSALALFRTSPDLVPGRIDVVARLLPHSNDLIRLLEQSGTGWRAGRFVLLTLASTLAAGGLARLFTGSWILALPAALAERPMSRWSFTRRDPVESDLARIYAVAPDGPFSWPGAARTPLRQAGWRPARR